MKYLNLGCGSHYLDSEDWTNLDFVSTGPGVIAHNLLDGIPFEDNTFDLVYHSHVLEHFSKEDGQKFIDECFRVLKPGGIIRMAVPDLEKITRNYLLFLEKGVENPDDSEIQANYDWMLLEMYDQTVRNSTGGNMARYLYQPNISNEDFVYTRIGEEGRSLRKSFLMSRENSLNSSGSGEIFGRRNFVLRLKNRIKEYLIKRLKVDEKAMAIGKFRLSGEVHQWMYDKYSLSKLLAKAGGKDIVVRDAFDSYNSGWTSYNIDGKNGLTRKPDSLFIEAIK